MQGPGHRWTNAQVAKLIKLWNDGVPIPDIAKKLDSSPCAIGTMVRRLRHYGIEMEKRTRGHRKGDLNSRWTQKDIDWLLKRRQEGATINQMAEELGRTVHSVAGMTLKLRKMGAPVGQHNSGITKLWSVEAIKAKLT